MTGEGEEERMTDVGFLFFFCASNKCTSRGYVTADTSSSRMKRPQWRRVGEEIGTWQNITFFSIARLHTLSLR